MWISQKMGTLEQSGSQTQLGEVTNHAGGITVQAVGAYHDMSIVSPWGITYLPPKGTKVLVQEVEDTAVCAGAILPTTGLEAGELMLRSAGGACIHLKNNGDVVINGQVFPLQTT